jgi:hypothetical protein
MASNEHIDQILQDWPYDPVAVGVRVCTGADGRELLQMRIDMGLLQLEVNGRPDGAVPHGAETYLDYLIERANHEGDAFVLSDDQCIEVDREFVQFYHRRVCWLKLQQYDKAVRDADHTLELMDFCLTHSPDETWTMSHEQYRPFVIFHRVQAATLAKLEQDGAEAAVHEVNCGLQRLQQLFQSHDAEDQFEDDELVKRLVELRESVRREYAVGRTLHEQLADAVAAEHYERAAELRDELERRGYAF